MLNNDEYLFPSSLMNNDEYLFPSSNQNYTYQKEHLPLNVSLFKETNNMTFIAGAYTTDGIVLASDSREILDDGSIHDVGKKIFKLTENAGVATAGWAEVNSSIIHDFKDKDRRGKEFIDSKKNDKNYVPPRDDILIKQNLTDVMKDYVKRTLTIPERYNIDMNLIVGICANNTGFLFHIECNNGYVRELFIDPNAGKNFVIGGYKGAQVQWHKYFEKKFTEFKPMEEVVSILKEGIEKFSKGYYMVGCPVQIATITPSEGFKLLSKKELNQY